MAEINVTGASSLYMKVDITNIRQNVSGNSSTVKFVASMRQTSGNNWNQVPGVDFKVVVNGSTKANQTGFFLDVRNNVTQVFYTGDIVIPHNTDGTKSFSWSFWFDPKGTWHTYKPTTLSGTQALPRIARVSNSTLSANTFDFGESFTVYTNQTDPSFTHTISYIRGTTVTSLATAVKTSKSVAIPTAQISNYTTATTASMKIRTSTYSGGTLVGDYDLDVTVKVPASAVPTIGAVTYSGSNAVFTGANQFIASKDRLKATVANVTTSYSSAIKTYLYRVSQRHTVSMEGTSNGATFPTFDFPATGSEVVNIQMAVVDARGRQSAWSTSSAIRVHAYQPPSIGAMTITRNANVTTVNVRRNWSVTDLLEGGTTARNTGALVINYRAVGESTWKATGGNASGRSGVNSNVALTPSFAGGTSYEFRIQLTDKFQTTTAPIIKIGTEFVPLDIGPKGIGVGKVHNDGGTDLQVGSGGIWSEGPLKATTFDVIDSRSLNPDPYVSGSANRGLSVHFKNSSTIGVPDTSTYSTLFDIQPWNEKSGGNHQQIAINSQGDVYGRLGITSWSAWKKFLTESSDGRLFVRGASNGSSITIGSYNSNWNHFVSDGSPFHFNRPVHIQGHAYAADANGNGYSTRLARVDEIPTVPTATYGIYTGTPRGVYTIGSARILHGVATATGNATSTFNSLGNTLTFPAAFSTNTAYPVTVNYSITSNVTDVKNRMITVNIRNVTRTGFVWDARDSASGTAPSGGTVYTLHWTAMGAR